MRGEFSLQEAQQGLGAFVARAQAETHVPGIALALSAGGERVYASAGTRSAAGGPPLTVHERFHLGCATKLLLAIASLELAQRGRIALAAPLSEYLPELAGFRHGTSVQVGHLLSHTSGYRGTNIFEPETRALDWNGFIAHLRGAPRLFEPGTVFSYEHTESVLLGRILERVTDRPSLALIRDMILEPLGIVPHSLDEDADAARFAGRNDFEARKGCFVEVAQCPAVSEFWYPAFSNYTIAITDLLTIGEAILGLAQKERPREEALGFDVPKSAAAVNRSAGGRAAAEVVSARTRRALLEPVVRLPPALGGPLSEWLPVGFGLGAAELSGGLYGHNGLTVGQCLGLRVDPERRLVAAAGINATVPHLRDGLLNAVLRGLHSEGRTGSRVSSDVARQNGLAFEAELSALAGVYLGPGSVVLEATVLGERLNLELVSGEHGPSFLGALASEKGKWLTLEAAMPQLSVGPFRDPATAELGFMLGLHAFKRTGSVRE